MFFPGRTSPLTYVELITFNFVNKINVFSFLQKFLRILSEHYYSKFKLSSDSRVPNEDVPERYGRSYAYWFACNSGNEQCLKDTYELLRFYVHENRKLPPGLESTILCHGLRGHGKDEIFIALWQKMQLTADTAEKLMLINALGCTENPEMLMTYLETSLGSGQNVNYTSAQKWSVFTSTLSSQTGMPVILEFLNVAQNEVANSYGRSMTNILTTVANYVKTNEDQFAFNNLLLKINSLSGDALRSISGTVSSNLNLQQSATNVNHMKQIQRVLNEWETGELDEGFAWILPKTSKPEYYKVHLDVRNVHTGSLGYNGEVTIDIRILEKTNRVLFHSKNQVISILRAYERPSMRDIEISHYRLTPATETILIYFNEELPVGATISIYASYSANLVTSRVTGFYQTSYVMNGVTKYVAATQFEEVGCRYAFLLYDG
jgi:ERAP1-like C-terminal domain/Peptidase M1 N-terminal domain